MRRPPRESQRLPSGGSFTGGDAGTGVTSASHSGSHGPSCCERPRKRPAGEPPPRAGSLPHFVDPSGAGVGLSWVVWPRGTPGQRPHPVGAGGSQSGPSLPRVHFAQSSCLARVNGQLGNVPPTTPPCRSEAWPPCLGLGTLRQTPSSELPEAGRGWGSAHSGLPRPTGRGRSRVSETGRCARSTGREKGSCLRSANQNPAHTRALSTARERTRRRTPRAAQLGLQVGVGRCGAPRERR